MAELKEKKQTKKDIFFECVIQISANNCPNNNCDGICLSAAHGEKCLTCNCYHKTSLRRDLRIFSRHFNVTTKNNRSKSGNPTKILEK